MISITQYWYCVFLTSLVTSPVALSIAWLICQVNVLNERISQLESRIDPISPEEADDDL